MKMNKMHNITKKYLIMKAAENLKLAYKNISSMNENKFDLLLKDIVLANLELSRIMIESYIEEHHQEKKELPPTFYDDH
jgi:hypothetical protein